MLRRVSSCAASPCVVSSNHCYFTRHTVKWCHVHTDPTTYDISRGTPCFLEYFCICKFAACTALPKACCWNMCRHLQVLPPAYVLLASAWACDLPSSDFIRPLFHNDHLPAFADEQSLRPHCITYPRLAQQPLQSAFQPCPPATASKP